MVSCRPVRRSPSPRGLRQDQPANAALYRMVIVRLPHGDRTKAYMRRRMREGMTTTEVVRCLGRYVAREILGIPRELGRGNLRTKGLELQRSIVFTVKLALTES